MDLILARHGNTFGPNDPVTWVGAKNDLPLVKKGLEQAEQLSRFLIHKKIKLKAIYCGELKRTRVYADRIVETLQREQNLSREIEPTIDSRLNEIDYGEWSGLTQEEVIQKFGIDEVQAWNQKSQWPRFGAWKGSDAQMFVDVQSFVAEIASRYSSEDSILVVTSQGRLRYFLKLVPQEFEERIRVGELKVKTGHFCRLAKKNKNWEVTAWNQEPSFFST